MAYLDDVKMTLRITHASLDTEITDLINAARQDLILSGVSVLKATSTTDPLIKRAVVTYTKAHFGYDNPDADRLLLAYERLKAHLTLSGDYT